MNENKINYSHGFFFPLGGLLFGGFILFIAISIFISAANIIAFCIGTAVICLGLLFFSTKGVDIDKSVRKVRQYTSVLGIKTGKKIPLSTFKYISVINQTYIQTSFNPLGPRVERDFGTFNVLLLNDTHHLKQFIKSFGTYESALAEAQKLSDALGLEIVTYDPVRTRLKRR